MRVLYGNKIYDPKFTDKMENGGLPGQVDIPRMNAGKLGGAFWSAFVPCPANGSDFSDAAYAPYVKTTLEQIDLFNRLSEMYPRYFTLAKDSASAQRAFDSNKLISPMGIEGLHQIGNSISTLRLYHKLGVRYATLTWNCHNAYADAALITNSDNQTVLAPPLWGGVSPAGKKLIQEMNRLGMLVDLSHVSQNTMAHVLGQGEDGWQGSIAPPIFSHSSAYSICPHPRNVPDHILPHVKAARGIIMVNANPDFISCRASNSSSGLPEFVPETSTLEQVVKHIKHIGDMIGYDYVGIGTDFDGIESTPKGFEDVSKFPDLVTEMLKQGISELDAGKVVGRNILRVWADADAVATWMQRKGILPLEDEVRHPWE
ncbi:hypothetical protein E4T47_01420 [Aureobasidium subglaciale]|nr:hypothetical protein E4T47_01420 [Aureobasidium subglaciale]